MEQKEKVKVRLARKWAIANPFHSSETTGDLQAEQDIVDAYLAGFERAKSLCVDFCQRYCDRRIDPPFSEDEELEWLKHFDPKKPQPSQHMSTIGEQR